MVEQSADDFVSSSPTKKTLPPYSRTWGNDVAGDKKRSLWKWRSRIYWLSAYRTATSKTKSALHVTGNFIRDQLWPILRKCVPSKAQSLAFLLLITFGAAPMLILGHFTPIGYGLAPRPFYRVFADKVLTCGNSFGTPQNSTVSGIANLFVLDNTFGRYSFSQVKTLDVAWDILVGRGVQLLAWWVGYVVFCDALLRAIERHPVSFEIFQRIALEGPSLHSLWTLLKELWRARSKRTKALFMYVWMSTLYITCIPLFLGAMTGYDSNSIAWVSLDDSNNIVPAAQMEQSGLVHATPNETFSEPLCIDHTTYSTATSRMYAQYGTCTYNVPNHNETYSVFNDDRPYRPENRVQYPCADTITITIVNQIYAFPTLNTDWGFCNNNKSYDSSFLRDRSRCLPDTSNPSYQWGFSTTMAGIFIFLHFGWCVTMYVVWQDAQIFSHLVKEGYEMTPLRAAFAMAMAARRKTGLGEGQLVRADTKEIKLGVYGGWKKKGASIDCGIFREGDEESGKIEGHAELVRRRVARGKEEAVVDVNAVRSSSA